MILCNFANQNDKTKFLSHTKLNENSDGSVIIPMSLISLARSLNGVVTQGTLTTHQYLVKVGHHSSINTPNCLVVSNHGENGLLKANSDNFWVVETQNGLALFDEFNGNVEQVDVPVKLMGEITTNITNVLPEGYDWPRRRINSRGRPLGENFVLANTNFIRKPNVVIIDSGINFTHQELVGLETEDLFALPSFNGNFRDDAGHGTAIASMVAGINTGLHRHLRLLNCKIFNSSYKPNAIEIGQALDSCYNKFMEDVTVPMVVNCSWTVAKNSYLEGKFKDLTSAGITVVCAAGNTGVNVDFLTPAGMAEVITVAASDIDDCGAGFNNFSQIDLAVQTNEGLRIDIFAPGVDIYGAHHSGNDMYCMFSGSSASSGFVTGGMAAILALVKNSYRETATKMLMDYGNVGQLLLDFDKFTFEQNRLLYLITSENHLGMDSMSYYLGALSLDNPTISGKTDIVLDYQIYSNATGEQFNLLVEWGDEAPQSELEGCITLDNTGNFVVSNPNLSWQPDEKIRLISFKVKAQSVENSITLKSPNIIFFATNPNVTESLTGDIATALENIDNQSFFAAWVKSLSIK